MFRPAAPQNQQMPKLKKTKDQIHNAFFETIVTFLSNEKGSALSEYLDYKEDNAQDINSGKKAAAEILQKDVASLNEDYAKTKTINLDLLKATPIDELDTDKEITKARKANLAITFYCGSVSKTDLECIEKIYNYVKINFSDPKDKNKLFKDLCDQLARTVNVDTSKIPTKWNDFGDKERYQIILEQAGAHIEKLKLADSKNESQRQPPIPGSQGPN